MPDEHGCSGHDDMDEAIEQWTPWELLPNDVWTHIIEQLDFNEKMVRICLCLCLCVAHHVLCDVS